MLTDVTNRPITGGGLTVVANNGSLFNPGTTLVAGGGGLSQPVGGGTAIGGNLAGGVQVNPTVVNAIPQSDELPLADLANGASIVVQLGLVARWIDAGVTAIDAGDVLMLDPNGVLHDFYLFTVKRADGDGWTQNMLKTPPGFYTFLNVSGAALAANVKVFAQHIGARNFINS